MISYYVIPGLKNCKVVFSRTGSVENVINKVCQYFGINRCDLVKRDRRKSLVDARFVTMRMLFDKTDLNKSQIANIFGMNPSNVSRHLNTPETLNNIINDIEYRLI